MANDDPKYKAWVEQLECCHCNAPAPSTMHHSTGGGMALRVSDQMGMPLCNRCHDALHRANGPFKGFFKQDFRDWQAAMVRLHRRLYLAEGSK